MALSSRLLALRHSPALLQLPPYLSALCLLVGLTWLFLLPLDDYSRNTYVSENAIMPGQVHTYFGGSEHHIFRAFRQEVYQLGGWNEQERRAGLGKVLAENGLKVATQAYRYQVAGETIEGVNVYGVLQGPRADATEAMVMMAAWKNFDGEINYSGVALALTLARYFTRWSIWSKDVIVLIPDDSTYGPDAWVSAYHSTSLEATASRNISALPIKSGALQGAVALDYPVGPWGHRFEKLDIQYDGINGALPNLDLLNTAVAVAHGQMGISCTLHNMLSHSDSYTDRLKTLGKGLQTQAMGHATGPHSAFMPYHVDAITLKTVGDGWHDEMSLGRTTESIFRSINNLLEHFHQSFFFYILLNSGRFVSIGNYLPAAMLIAGSFTVSALALWVQSGWVPSTPAAAKPGSTDAKGKLDTEMEIVKEGNDVALVSKARTEVAERNMFLPALLVLGTHLSGFVPLWWLTHSKASRLPLIYTSVSVASTLLPPSLSYLSTHHLHATRQQIQILQSFSLLLLGAALSTLATLNFSQAFVVGVTAAPLSFARPIPAKRTPLAIAAAVLGTLVYCAVSPGVLFYAFSQWSGQEISSLLLGMAKGWSAQGVYTAGVIWVLWWPAWILGGIALYSDLSRLI
ncbi:Glycosylphosphatidylinositol:protein transamidase, GAA1 component [Teratosphaeria nubilosa]|uniref:Glycosylphosphatidylinositol:protein transamidase, GAA1 component n=1 Tax=Teratosphaeria nubilosa TaxID=161662 RepID=A0A6G1LLT7_9PEZI|nr:Glycosylphosphatidylinositol:protein transamidase, GAA1 component [Teratosphaeria nubilosa]